MHVNCHARLKKRYPSSDSFVIHRALRKIREIMSHGAHSESVIL